jgi:hypothetical protein
VGLKGCDSCTTLSTTSAQPQGTLGLYTSCVNVVFLAFLGIKWFSFAFCEYVHNKFIYIHINSRLYYLRCKLIYLINSNDKILTILNELIISMELHKGKQS